MRKSISIVTSVALTVAGLATYSKWQAAASTPAAAQDKIGYTDTLTITAFNWGWADPVPGKDKVKPVIEKRVHLKDLEYQTIKVGSYDDVLQKEQLWASTGATDWPDILATGADGKTKLIINNLGEAGKIEDLTPWLERYPKVKKAVEKLLPFCTDPTNGKLYAIPQNFGDYKAQPIDASLWIRKDWLDQLHLPYPKTVDQFYNTMQQFKDKIKNVNGQPIVPYEAFGENFMNMFSIFFPEGEQGWYTDRTGHAARGEIVMPDKLVNALTFYNKLYNAGLLDKESFTIKQGQVDEKGNQGRIGALHGSYWQMANPYTDTMQKTNPNAMFIGIPLYDPRVSKAPYPPKVDLQLWSLFTVKAGLPKAEVNTFFKTLNYVLSEQGQILVHFGVQGQQWQYNAHGKIEATKAFVQRTKGDWNKGAEEGVDTYTFIPNYAVQVKMAAPSPTELRKDMQITWANLGHKYAVGYVTDPQAYVTPGPVENRVTLGASDRYKQMVTQAVTATSPSDIPAIVQKWVDTEKALGYDKVAAERTAEAKAIHLENIK